MKLPTGAKLGKNHQAFSQRLYSKRPFYQLVIPLSYHKSSQSEEPSKIIEPLLMNNNNENQIARKRKHSCSTHHVQYFDIQRQYLGKYEGILPPDVKVFHWMCRARYALGEEYLIIPTRKNG